MSTYYICTDSDGKMPVMSKGVPVREHYIKYVNDVPVEGKLYKGQDRVWDYSKERMFGLHSNVPSFVKDEYLPRIQNFKAL